MTERRILATFPDYAVSDDGTVWVRRHGEWFSVKPEMHGGYCRVVLRNGSAKRRVYVHTLVLETFVGPRPAGMQARHFPDRDGRNNRLDNLQWGTSLQNAADKLPQGSRIGRQKLTESEVRAVHAEGEHGSPTAVARKHGLSRAQVCEIWYGTTWLSFGLKPWPRRHKSKGSRHYMTQLSEDDVRYIRQAEAAGERSRWQLAKQFGLTYSAVCKIVQRKTWNHVV